MAKNAKKPPIHNGKPITAFFARSSKGPPGSSQDASRSTTQPLTKSSSKTDSDNTDNSMNLSRSSRLASKSPTKATSGVNSEAPNTPRNPEKNTTLMSPISKVSVKRSRSPELQTPQTPSATTVGENLNGSRRFPERSKSKFDNELEVDKSSNDINAYSTPNPKSKKRARLASEEPILSDLSDLVPSSQSDEEELTLVKNEAIPHASIATMSGLPPSNGEYEDSSMEVDDLLGQQSSQSSDQIMTPPSGHFSVPPTPVALDAASKTAKIIADIKAKAYAQAMSSPETAPLEFNDVSDSSSDEEEFLPILPTTMTVSSKSTSDSSPKGSSMAIRRSARNAAKHSSTSPMDGSRPQAPSARLASSVSTNHRIQTKKPTAADPFAALLKEKRIAQKNGNGSDAFNRAEIRTHSFGDLLEETVEDESDESTEPDEDLALAIAQNSKLFDNDLVTNGSKIQDTAFNDEDDPRKTLFGERGGRGIRDILEQDKALKKHDESSEKNPGIDFWAPRQNALDTAMVHDTSSSSSYQQLLGSNTLTRLFNTLLQRNDLSRAGTLLNNNFIGSLETNERPFIASNLYDLAFSLPPSPASIGAGAIHALEEFWNSSAEPIENGISFARVLSTIQSLGVNPSILSSQEWPIVNVMQSEDITTSFREYRIQSLIVLISACARSKRLRKGDIPDIILVLLLVGMDNSTSPNLWREIIATVNLTCQYIANDTSTSAQLETQVCLKLLKCVSIFDPVNKARVVYLLSTASGPTRRIANVVAYCIITDKERPYQQMFSEPPPLSDVIDQLVPYSKTSTLPPGKFALHEKTDYVDLGFYTTILGVAVSNLRSYVVQERQLSVLRNSTSPRRGGEKPKTDLQLLYASLETLHSNISDTRATHLERSRAKANIKGLAMNIHYQREHWSRNLPDSRAKTLAEYFVKKPKP